MSDEFRDEVRDEVRDDLEEMSEKELDILEELLDIRFSEPDENAERHLRADVMFVLGSAVVEYDITASQAEGVIRDLADDLGEHGFDYRRWG